MEVYPLEDVDIKNWKITMLNGYVHYFDWAIFNSELLNYQKAHCLSVSGMNFHLLWLLYFRFVLDSEKPLSSVGEPHDVWTCEARF